MKKLLVVLSMCVGLLSASSYTPQLAHLHKLLSQAKPLVQFNLMPKAKAYVSAEKHFAMAQGDRSIKPFKSWQPRKVVPAYMNRNDVVLQKLVMNGDFRTCKGYDGRLVVFDNPTKTTMVFAGTTLISAFVNSKGFSNVNCYKREKMAEETQELLEFLRSKIREQMDKAPSHSTEGAILKALLLKVTKTIAKVVVTATVAVVSP